MSDQTPNNQASNLPPPKQERAAEIPAVAFDQLISNAVQAMTAEQGSPPQEQKAN